VLRGRHVVIWPDHDPAGANYAADAAELLRRACAGSVRLVEVPPDWPDGWDVADPLPDGATVATLRAMVKDAVERGTVELPDKEADIRPPEFTDEALALAFTAAHADRLRYVAGWGRWFIWTRSVWKADDTLRAFDLARAICRSASSLCGNAKVAVVVASAKTVAAVERLAKADRRHAATVDQWDADPWLLNTFGGVVDLRTGTMRPHRPDDSMTKITPTPPGGDCPLWRTFLARVTGGNSALQAFLQRAAGYALTGSTREHALFFFYGSGGNGKGVFLNTLTGVLGTYAAVASMETFTASQCDRHPTDIAMLHGARLVTAQETEEGRYWAEARIKGMTGGDPISARFMRQDFFTFVPAFKLFVAGNHKPALRNVDEAIRRRLHLVPFEVQIPLEERDASLTEKLKGERPGILAWAIAGCQEWQRIGLAPPMAVRDATCDYLEAEDALGQWLHECCDQSAALWDSSASLFASWRVWGKRTGEFVGSQKRFSQAITARRFKPQRGNHGHAGFMGLCVKQPTKGERHPAEDGLYSSADPSEGFEA
jgi:putative DNA primase/helicase